MPGLTGHLFHFVDDRRNRPVGEPDADPVPGRHRCHALEDLPVPARHQGIAHGQDLPGVGRLDEGLLQVQRGPRPVDERSGRKAEPLREGIDLPGHPVQPVGNPTADTQLEIIQQGVLRGVGIQEQVRQGRKSRSWPMAVTTGAGQVAMATARS